VSVDGSEDDQINIKDLEGYAVDDGDESNPFASSDSSSSASDSDDSQCDDDEIILSSEYDDKTPFRCLRHHSIPLLMRKHFVHFCG